MKTLIKRLLQVSLALVVLVVAAVIILPLVIDPNDYKPEIQQAVKEQTGRDLEIVGDIKLNVFPSLAFSMGATSFSNAKGFNEKAMVSMEQLDIGMSLRGLLSGEIRNISVNLESPTIYLGKLENGDANWQDILEHQLAKQKTDESAEEPIAEPESTEESGGGVDLTSLDGVTLTNATVYWDDQSTGEKTVITNLDLEVTAYRSGQPFDVTLTSAIGEKGKDGKLDLSSTVILDIESKHYVLQDIVANLIYEGTDVDFKANADVNMAKQLIAISGLDAKVNKKGLGELTLTAETAVDLNAQTLTMSQLALENGELSLTGNLQGNNILGDPEVAAEVVVKEMNLRQWLKAKDIELSTRNPKAYEKFKGQLNVTAKLAKDSRIKVKLDNTELDQTTVKGDVSVFIPESEKADMGINAKLALGVLNVDDYLPPATETESASETNTSASTDVAVNLDFLQGLNVLANLVIADLTVSEADLNKVDANVVVKNGVLTSRLFIPETHQGKIDANVTAKSSPNNKAQQRVTVKAIIDKSVSANASQSGINLGLLQQSLLKEILIAGLGKGTVNLDMQGASVNAFKKSLDGNFDLGIKDGQVMNMDFMSYIRQGVKTVQQLSGEPVSNFALQENNETNKIAASISGVIKNGVITSDDLNGLAPAMRLGGKGKINLVDMSMDYTTTLKLVETSKGQGGDAADKLKGLPIPVRCKGSFDKLDCSADYESLGKAWLEKNKEELKAKAASKIEDKISEKLGTEKTEQIKGILDAFGGF